MPKRIQLLRNSEILPSYDDAVTLLSSVNTSDFNEGELITCSYTDFDGTIGVLHGLVVNGLIAIINNADFEPDSNSCRPVQSRTVALIAETISENYVTNATLDLELDNKLDKTASAVSASKLTTARNINLDTAVTATAKSFNGTSSITIPVNTIKEAYTVNGGKNIECGLSAVDVSLVNEYGANRFALLNPNGINVETSSDGGSTWLTQVLDNAQKSIIVGQLNNGDYTFKIPTGGSNGRLRITFEGCGIGGGGVTGCDLCTDLNKFLIYVIRSSNGKVTIEGATFDNPDTWITIVNNVSCSGWPNVNVINLSTPITFGTMNTQKLDTKYRYLRFTFSSTSSTLFTVGNIMAFGGTGNRVSSNLAKHNHLYSYDVNENATFPAKVIASSFEGSASLTGTPTAPTAPAGTSTNLIATTKFVQNILGDIQSILNTI